MNKLTYRFTLDTHKNGIQRTLQGFETGDTVDRILEISLTSNGQTVELENYMSAVLYVKTANDETLNMDSTRIVGNACVCKLSDASLAVAGISECQLVVFDGQGNKLFSPKFQVEIWDSLMLPSDNVDIPLDKYEALQQAIRDAEDAKHSSLVSVDFKDKSSEDYTLVFEKEDGTAYEVDGLTELMAYIKEHSKGVQGDKGDKGDRGEKGDKGDKGEPGNSGVYIGASEPSDANVWIDINGEPDNFVTEDIVADMIADAIGGALNGRY